jgi:hypothetical protein
MLAGRPKLRRPARFAIQAGKENLQTIHGEGQVGADRNVEPALYTVTGRQVGGLRR